MKLLFKNTLIITGFLGLLVSTGCKKQLDINVSPNNPAAEQGTPSVVLPAGIFGTTASVGGEYAILGSIWGQYVTQSAFSSQYKTIDAYQLSSSDINTPYKILFANGLKNYQFVIDKSEATSNWNFYLMATTMKAYSAQVLVDLYDQIPYFEALQGVNNLSPKFDDGYTIYQDLLNSLDTALSKPIDPDILTPADKTADIIFQGDMDKWQRFAHSLEMKIYLRMVNKKPDEAQAGIQKLYAAGAQFLDTDAGVSGFTDVLAKDNPMYEYNIRNLNTTDNLRASKTFSSFLADKNDPRNTYYFGSLNPTPINQGDYTGTDPSYQSATRLIQDPTDPVIFISLAEFRFHAS
ncbi:MAG: SusD/RagB family nutrient-binding outer membrane lipoprotein [Segetibacter sp.]